jgi:hypothetical protein
MSSGRAERGGSTLWRAAFRAAYRFLRIIDPLLRLAWRAGLPGLGSTVDLVVPGRCTGRSRQILLTLLVVDDRWYVGHPNGRSAWTRNLEASGRATIRLGQGENRQLVAVELPAGPERARVISLTPALQPFPGNILYALAQDHIQAVGVYFRLEAAGPEP